MKKICAILLSVILLLQMTVGMAQVYYNIEELNENVVPHWQQTYETKWRTIDINITPTIPDATQAPVFIANHEFPLPDFSAVDKQFIINEHTDPIAPFAGGSDKVIVRKRVDGNFSIDSGELLLYGRDVYDYEGFSVSPRPPFDMQKNYSENAPFTLGEVMTECARIIEEQGMDSTQWTFENPYELTINALQKKFNLPDVYCLVVKQKLFDIPVLEYVGRAMPKAPAEEIVVSPSMIRFNYATSDVFTASIRGLNVQEVVVEDIPLCDFSLVKQTLENEINAGRLREMFALELGYVIYNHPDSVRRNQIDYQGNPDREKGEVLFKEVSFYGVPTWYVECLYVDSPTQEVRTYEGQDVPWNGGMEYAQLAINAQTGELLKRTANFEGCTDYQGVLTWEDVK